MDIAIFVGGIFLGAIFGFLVMALLAVGSCGYQNEEG
jgi:hypothetical protein